MGAEILKLENGIRPYAWGSTTALAELLGRPNPQARPEAELWIGAHPVQPSRALTREGQATLIEIIRRAPATALGAEVIGKLGPELPFLLKVLAVAAPLSIQCHPNREQARAGFARENRQGVPLDAPTRNYRDANHKPELIVALTPFTALRGFRPAREALEGLQAIGSPALTPVLAVLAERGDAGLESFYSRLMSLPPAGQADVVARTARLSAARDGADPTWHWVSRLAARYPTDIGILAPLYLNLIVLAPEQALFLPAGELHAYLDGLSLEIMASSDNVLRCGLTPKHVDLAELMSLLVFRAGRPEILAPQARPDGARVYETPAEEFELGLLEAGPSSILVSEKHGVEILLVLDGRARLQGDAASVQLSRGESAFVPAAAGAYRLAGPARLVRARVPGLR